MARTVLAALGALFCGGLAFAVAPEVVPALIGAAAGGVLGWLIGGDASSREARWQGHGDGPGEAGESGAGEGG